MIDFSINFANNTLAPADLVTERFFWHAEFVLEKNRKIHLLSNLTFENFVSKLSLSIGKKVACAPYLAAYPLRIQQYLEEKVILGNTGRTITVLI